MAPAPIWRLSGGSANADPAASLGGEISSVEVQSNLFDDIQGSESGAGNTEYRGIYVVNTGDAALQNTKVWIQVQTPDTDTAVAIALCDEGYDQTMETIADEDTAPVGPTFSAPADKASGLSLGTLAAGGRYGVWVRRTVNAGASAYSDDGFTIRVDGDSP